jgi:hypothetical protein
MLSLKEGQLKIFVVNMIYLLIALYVFIGRANYEFVLYIGVIVFFLILILLTNKKVNYPNSVLWGLTVWGILHMLGGGLLLEGNIRLYELMLITISSKYNFFRYDQLVHLIGFAVATLVMWVLVAPSLKSKVSWWSTGIIVVMAGLGVGALNEIIEFIAVILVPETGVGGYINVAMDLVADLVGAIIAMIWIRLKKGKL